MIKAYVTKSGNLYHPRCHRLVKGISPINRRLEPVDFVTDSWMRDATCPVCGGKTSRVLQNPKGYIHDGKHPISAPAKRTKR